MQIRSGFPRAVTPLGFAVAWGVALRLWYGLLTDHAVRAHDVRGHLEYIAHMSAHWSLPPGNAGAEYWQSPLYYVAAGLWRRLLHALEFPDELILLTIRLFSVAMSVGVFLLGVRIARELLPAPEEKPALAACALGLASLPSLVFLSSRISNDVPFALVSFGILLLLLRWWRTGGARDWRLLWALIGIGVLIKLSALVFAAAAVACLAAARGRPSVMLQRVSEAVFILCVLAGWLFVLRSFEPANDRLLSFGNAYLNQRLRVPTGWESFLTFRPWFIVTMPFNHPFLDLAGRQYVWEYLFRSFFFGEFAFRNLVALCTGIVASALALLPFFFLGMADYAKRAAALPLLCICAAATGSILLYRLAFPLSANQDARFMPVLGFFLCFYAAAGVWRAPQFLRTFAAGLYLTLCVLCSALLMLLAGRP